MKKIIRLTESNLVKIVQKIIKESQLITEINHFAKFTYTKIQNSGGKWLIEGKVSNYDWDTSIYDAGTFKYYGQAKEINNRYTTINGKKMFAPVFEGEGNLTITIPGEKYPYLYKGLFKNNYLNGKGTIRRKNKESNQIYYRSGNFVNGGLEGQGRVYDKYSNIYGTFKNDTLNGPVTLSNDKGLKVNANAINSEINGHSIYDLVGLTPDEYNQKIKNKISSVFSRSGNINQENLKNKWYTYFDTNNKEDKAYAYQKRNGIWYSRLKSKWDDEIEIGLSDPKFKKSVDALNQAETDNRLKEFTK